MSALGLQSSPEAKFGKEQGILRSVVSYSPHKAVPTTGRTHVCQSWLGSLTSRQLKDGMGMIRTGQIGLVPVGYEMLADG